MPGESDVEVRYDTLGETEVLQYMIASVLESLNDLVT